METTMNRRDRTRSAKFLWEMLWCVLHPVAVLLIWFRLPLRGDLSRLAKCTWAIASLIPLMPFLYVLTGNELW